MSSFTNLDAVQTYHDLHKVLNKLTDTIRHHRYTDDRGGIIPPGDAMEAALVDVRDACATIALLTNEQDAASFASAIDILRPTVG